MKHPRLAGNRRKDMGVLEKYQEILKVLQKMDDEFYTEDEKALITSRNQVNIEYRRICEVVQA